MAIIAGDDAMRADAGGWLSVGAAGDFQPQGGALPSRHISPSRGTIAACSTPVSVARRRANIVGALGGSYRAAINIEACAQA